MSTATGSFVLDVALARAAARDGQIGVVALDGDTVEVTYDRATDAYRVTSGSLFGDGPLTARVSDLLARHG